MLCPFVRAMMQGSKYWYLSINEIGFDPIDSLFYLLIFHDFVSNQIMKIIISSQTLVMSYTCSLQLSKNKTEIF